MGHKMSNIWVYSETLGETTQATRFGFKQTDNPEVVRFFANASDGSTLVDINTNKGRAQLIYVSCAAATKGAISYSINLLETGIETEMTTSPGVDVKDIRSLVKIATNDGKVPMPKCLMDFTPN